MPNFSSYDGASLSYRLLEAREGTGDRGARAPLICLAGGPGRDADYLEDLGGLDAHRPLVIPDSRGTGQSLPAADPSGYAFPRLAEDLEALRRHLGLDGFALLAHAAAATTAQAYAAHHGDRLTHLVLVAPGTRLLGERTEDAQEIFRSRAGEPWFDDAQAALEQLQTETDFHLVKELLFRIAPISYGSWGERQREHAAGEGGQLRPVARAGFWQGVEEGTRRGIVERLGEVDCPVLVLTGELDAAVGVRAGELVSGCFARARHTTLRGVGHYPWVDDPEGFRAAVEAFLDQS